MVVVVQLYTCANNVNKQTLVGTKTTTCGGIQNGLRTTGTPTMQINCVEVRRMMKIGRGGSRS